MYLCGIKYKAMTRKEEELLRKLTLSIERLKLLAEKQREMISKLEKVLEEEKNTQKDLLQEGSTLREKYELLLSARSLVADGEDWLRSRKRLEKLRKDIIQGIKLLETE